MINAEGDLEKALAEWNVRYNKTDICWYNRYVPGFIARMISSIKTPVIRKLALLAEKRV